MYTLAYREYGNGFAMIYLNGFPGRAGAQMRMARGGSVSIKPPDGYGEDEVRAILAGQFGIVETTWARNQGGGARPGRAQRRAFVGARRGDEARHGAVEQGRCGAA